MLCGNDFLCRILGCLGKIWLLSSNCVVVVRHQFIWKKRNMVWDRTSVNKVSILTLIQLVICFFLLGYWNSFLVFSVLHGINKCGALIVGNGKFKRWLWWQVYHSSFADEEGITIACGCPLLPLKSHIKGPAPASDQGFYLRCLLSMLNNCFNCFNCLILL